MAIKKKKLALKQAPPHHCVLCKKSLRELAVFKRFAFLFSPLKWKFYWISPSVRSPKFFIVYSLILKMARFLYPLVVEAREPKSSEAMKLPTTIFLFVYLYAKFPWSFERAFEWILLLTLFLPHPNSRALTEKYRGDILVDVVFG